MLKYFKIARSSYYYEVNTYSREDYDKDIKDQIKAIFDANKQRYGYRRITLELRNQGITVNHKRVKRLMKILGLFGCCPRAKYKSYKGELGKICKNLCLIKEENKENNTVQYYRNFITTAPDQKWTTDVSEFHIAAGKLYFSPILDMHTREIISYNISTHPTFNQILDMLKKAFKNHPNLDGLIFHSDQGWQYQMKYYRDELSKHGIRQSMSRKGNCYDNSPMENFFGVMKKEMFIGHEYEFKTLEELKEAMIQYIKYYNKTRISTKLKGMSPLMYRQHSLNNLILNQ